MLGTVRSTVRITSHSVAPSELVMAVHYKKTPGYVSCISLSIVERLSIQGCLPRPSLPEIELVLHRCVTCDALEYTYFE